MGRHWTTGLLIKQETETGLGVKVKITLASQDSVLHLCLYSTAT